MKITAEVKRGHDLSSAFLVGAGEYVERSSFELEYEFTLAEHVTLDDIHHAIIGLHEQLTPKVGES
jgi:hypothetical protein